jgi:signal transduction histidine kinase
MHKAPEPQDDRLRRPAQDEATRHMAALGSLALGVAHDLNNLLQPIAMMSDELLARIPEGAPERDYVLLIRQAGTRARDLVRRLLAVTHRDPPQTQPIDLAAFVADALPLLKRGVPPHITVRPELEAVPAIVGDESQIHQVLLNLVINATQAIGAAGGEIAVSVAPVLAGSGCARARQVRLSVADNGCGMDAETQRHAFDPFFTTKPATEGSGLGLAIVQRIVAMHGGLIELDSATGRGTRVDVYFPAA